MRFWGEPYYLGLLSAAERHGAAHQRPQSCQMILRKNRAALSCGEVRVEFIARGDLEKMPVATVNTPVGVLRYATPEVTALELIGYQRKKERDLFDLWHALNLGRLDPARLLACFQRHLSEEGRTVTRAQFEENRAGRPEPRWFVLSAGSDHVSALNAPARGNRLDFSIRSRATP
ncbi:MAG: nucleotidyl transferase AbiEii/AbiGii toxin family protein [Polyangiaceae bacterium]|nr:nucleotidyl transferase AbiEii/AbiGii toxin family protein [Polyangiaceae bacterium]